MNIFKRFGDFCAGFAAFSAIIYLFREFMAYSPEGEVSVLEKLKLFLSFEPRRDYRFYLPMIGLFLLSLAISLLFHKRPYLSFAASVLPMLQVLTLFISEKLYERPMLYLILAIGHMAGCLWECIRLDRTKSGRRAALGVDLCGLVGVGLCLRILREVKLVGEMETVDMSLFQRKILAGLEEADLTVFYVTAALLGGTILVRWLLRDLYYLDALLALPLPVYTIYLWEAGRIPFHGSILSAVCITYALARLVVMLSCKPKIKASNATSDEDTAPAQIE